MGYQTKYTGSVEVVPPLNEAEIEYLNDFADRRHADYNQYPDVWCCWIPAEDGTRIKWSGQEKFYKGAEWMKFLIDHFLTEGGGAQLAGSDDFDWFTFDHVVNGVIEAQGEEPGDHWDLVVENNIVKCRDYEVVVTTDFIVGEAEEI